MNRKLIELYVANKLAIHDPLFQEAKAKLTRGGYRKLVMNQKMNEVFTPENAEKIAKVIEDKYKIQKHGRLFVNPTVGQWLSDVIGIYTVDDILAYFSRETQIHAKTIAAATIGGQVIMRPALIWMVENIEAATGRQLTMLDTDAPLAYLGDKVTVKEIAKYFAESSEVISRLRRRYCHHSESGIEDALIRFKPIVIATYRICAGIPQEMSDDELLASKLKSWAPKDFPKNEWDLPVFWLEDDLNLNLPIVSKWVNDETTIADLVRVTMETKRKMLIKTRI